MTAGNALYKIGILRKHRKATLIKFIYARRESVGALYF